MSSLSHLSYAERASRHRHPLAQKLFKIAEQKKTNLVLSADVTTSKELLELANAVGPQIAVLKTHIDILADFSPATISGLVELKRRHNFLIFEDRKFVDIGHTVQLQYHGGALKISEWADIVNVSMVSGPSIVTAMAEVVRRDDFTRRLGNGSRALLILAEMTSKGNVANGEYTKISVDAARAYPDVVMGFVALRQLGDVPSSEPKAEGEDMVVFTTGVNIGSKGDSLGQTYQTPESVFPKGTDFIICGRGIYKAEDPVRAAAEYRSQGWEAYQKRIQG